MIHLAAIRSTLHPVKWFMQGCTSSTQATDPMGSRLIFRCHNDAIQTNGIIMKVIFLIMLTFFAMNAIYAAEQKRITVDQARALALTAAILERHDIYRYPLPKTYSLEHSGYSDRDINILRFMNFTIVYPDDDFPAGQAGHDSYVVDFYTGNVFQPPSRDACAYPDQPFDEVKTKKLAQLQKEVRRTLGLTRAAYQRLRTQKPGCKGLKVPASLLQAPNSEEIWSKPDYSASSLK